MLNREKPDNIADGPKPVWTAPSPLTRYAGAIAAAATMLASMAGCSVEPFNPKAEVAITSVEPSVARPTWSNGRTVLPLARVNVTSANTIPMTIDAYRLDYRGPDGKIIEMPAIGRSGLLTRKIDAMSATESSAKVTPLTMEIFTPAVYDYACNGTTSESSDDITPISATITFTGKDINNNVIEIMGGVTLSTTPAYQDAVVPATGAVTGTTGSVALTVEVQAK